jgi:hypothetical protein
LEGDPKEFLKKVYSSFRTNLKPFSVRVSVRGESEHTPGTWHRKTGLDPDVMAAGIVKPEGCGYTHFIICFKDNMVSVIF